MGFAGEAKKERGGDGFEDNDTGADTGMTSTGEGDEVAVPAIVTEWLPVGGPDLARFCVRRLDGRPFFDFEPGQYARLGWRAAGDDGPRPAYLSIASEPGEPRRLEFYVTRFGDAPPAEEGRPSLVEMLFAERVGAELTCAGPSGRFCLHRTSLPRVTLVASGTGLAPFVSMLRQSYSAHRASHDDGRRFVLLHGVRYGADLGFRAELETMAADPGFALRYVPTVSRPDPDGRWPEGGVGWGRVNDLLRTLLGEAPLGPVEPRLPDAVEARRLTEGLSPDQAAVYLCGNHDMIADSLAALAAAGFETEGEGAQVITEDHW